MIGGMAWWMRCRPTTTSPTRAAADAGRDHFAAFGKRLLDMDEAAIEALSHEAAALAL